MTDPRLLPDRWAKANDEHHRLVLRLQPDDYYSLHNAALNLGITGASLARRLLLDYAARRPHQDKP